LNAQAGQQDATLVAEVARFGNVGEITAGCEPSFFTLSDDVFEIDPDTSSTRR
jgi:hypothetical protein